MVFSKRDTDLDTFTAVKHHIDTGNSKPIKQRMRRTPLGYANEEQEHQGKFLKAGVIEPSFYILPPTFTSGLYRCTGGMQVFHYLEWGRDKTAFVTKYDLFYFRIIPFGLCNAPATFSRSVSLVLRGLSWKSVIASLDDVVIYGRDFDSHIVNLSDVGRRFEQYGMKLKPNNCQLLQNSVVFLGRLVSREGGASLS